MNSLKYPITNTVVRIFKWPLKFLDLTIAQNEGCYGQIDRSRHF